MKREAALLRMAGGSIALAASVMALSTVWALFDPTGAQMANDTAPFGAPPSMARMLGRLAIELAVAAAGIWLWWRPRSASSRRADRSTRDPIAGDREQTKELE